MDTEVRVRKGIITWVQLFEEKLIQNFKAWGNIFFFLIKIYLCSDVFFLFLNLLREIGVFLTNPDN